MNRPYLVLGFAILAALGFLGATQLIVEAPREATMGVVQKIFYFHVPCAWLCFLSAFLCAAASVRVLTAGAAGSARAVAWLDATAELTVLFGACVLVTGPLWARKAWGAYWQWDVRLTTSLLLWLIFAGVLFVRRYGGAGGTRLAAGLAIFGAADVPLIYASVSLWRTIHPKTTVVKTLEAEMRPAFWTSLLTFTIAYVVLLAMRVALSHAERRLDEVHRAAEDLEDLEA